MVPVWLASPKQETAARTFRPKITSYLPEFLKEFPPAPTNPGSTRLPAPVDWAKVNAGLEVDRSVPEVEWCVPGATAAMATLDSFVQARLKLFDSRRNDPNVVALSDTSPYTHFGQIAPQRAALYVKKRGRSHGKAVAAFVEESVVRRELADNFCFYQPNYDSLDGAAEWARASLKLHSSDAREFVYTAEELEAGSTHDSEPCPSAPPSSRRSHTLFENGGCISFRSRLTSNLHGAALGSTSFRTLEPCGDPELLCRNQCL